MFTKSSSIVLSPIRINYKDWDQVQGTDYYYYYHYYYIEKGNLNYFIKIEISG